MMTGPGWERRYVDYRSLAPSPLLCCSYQQRADARLRRSEDTGEQDSVYFIDEDGMPVLVATGTRQAGQSEYTYLVVGPKLACALAVFLPLLPDWAPAQSAAFDGGLISQDAMRRWTREVRPRTGEPEAEQ